MDETRSSAPSWSDDEAERLVDVDVEVLLLAILGGAAGAGPVSLGMGGRIAMSEGSVLGGRARRAVGNQDRWPTKYRVLQLDLRIDRKRDSKAE